MIIRSVNDMQTYIETALKMQQDGTALPFATIHRASGTVEFKTDSLNEKSRTALRRIGAIEEGIFHNHMLTYSGRVRHTVYYSIIDSEWPDVKAKLESVLASKESPG